MAGPNSREIRRKQQPGDQMSCKVKHRALRGREEAFSKEKLGSHGKALLRGIRTAPCSLLGLFPACL